MGQFEGLLRMPTDVNDPGLPVTADFTDGTLGLTAESGELGRWMRDHVVIVAEEDGFHLRADGEEVILQFERDAEFAVEAGLTNAPPVLRRKMSSLLRRRE